MRICFHTHCFPDKLAPRAMEALSDTAKKFGGVPHTDGTVAGAKRLLSAAGIDGALVCNIATNARQEYNVNSFAIETHKAGGFFFAAGSLHPDSEQKEAELDRLLQAGIRGIKIHPDYVGIEITDPRYAEIFALAEERDMFVVTHCGFDPVCPDHVHADPRGLYTVLKAHPRLKLIAAHMGGPRQLGEFTELLAGSAIMFDTSLSSTRPDERDALYALLRSHDPSRILFGTDTPWSDPAAEIAFLEGSGLDGNALDMIFYRNAVKLLGV